MTLSISRMDLDGNCSPIALVTKILKLEPNLKIPIPIEELAYKLDINSIQELTTAGYEGGLVTDEARSSGDILIKKGMYHQRRRFTIGHELAHFLISYHKPSAPNGFLCDKTAMNNWDLKEQIKARKMEAQANQFASLILIPPPQLRKILNRDRFTYLDRMFEIHEFFDVSKEAAARSFVEYNPECVSILICKDGKLLRKYSKRDFPWIKLNKGQAIPDISALYTHPVTTDKTSSLQETMAKEWIDVKFGSRTPKMYEQVVHQNYGYSMIMLKTIAFADMDYDPEENLTSKQRLAKRAQNR
ncbi:MAG: hypothetical protein COA43_11505 [Robiginitomaculum sp.]|nr:MAG: hypothetical protein COA43_11505 [Robiginitomaculum sp.]